MHSSSTLLFWVLFFLFFFFNFPSLSIPFLPATTNVTLFGTASFKDNAISLTQELTCLTSPSPPPPPSSDVGRALYFYPIRFLDFTTNTTASFSCRFSFSINPSSSCPFGDGIAFLITSNATSFSISDGHMGLPDQALNPQDSFVAVEFDTSFNPGLGDINDNHIGIDINTVISFASVDAVSKGIDLKSGKQITAWIEYIDASKMIWVWLGYSPIRPLTPLLVAQIDLSQQFKEFMHVGFSASNGQGSAIHTVDRWLFKTFQSLPSAIPMETVGEGVCFMCSRPSSNIDSSSSNNNNSNNSNSPFNILNNKKKIGELILGSGGLAAFLVSVFGVLVLIVLYMIRKRKPNCRISQEGQIRRMHTNRMPKRLSLAEIRSATKGFNRNRIIGEGGSSTVYHGSLPSAGEVAIKRFIKTNQTDCFNNPFAIEFATMASCLRHRNLVQFQGWCCEGDELVLVFEYLPNGSLNKILHQTSNSSSILTWEQREKIVLGVASALTYLHEECDKQIIHRDVKSCNIMLDAEFNAKLGDFGLAEIYEHSSVSTREATVPAGTRGYLAPEYVYSGIPTVKSDVYSFGVVILEVATGRRPVDDDGIVAVDWVWDKWEKGKLMIAVDYRLRGRFKRVEMERMLIVGLSCVHPCCEKRPTAKEAAMILRGEAPLPILPARKPKVQIQSVLPEDSEMLHFGRDCSSPGLDNVPWSTPKSHFG